ncbi:prolipoprotein diacylglyceryl transferase [Aminomonas paucivorans DSM 12260]|uniref:Prolipoprotein diacylglyceryl transferase n=2 Tax=Aminomonas TaxID=81411 RepID=E3CXH7_9BACT|nr:prolipoprotein diacylglyceryl transferase [Aminomonas paucivorans]EFQ23543.1 prolipoprotein diacylglyceryl transferase [Aminomonas paucivorans DSM 12260]
MFPVLFNLGPLEVQSYYVLWTTALCLFVLTSRRRAVARYGLDYDDVTDVLFWVFLGCLVGARLGGYGDYWSYYVAHPEKILRVWEGAMSSGPAFLGGGLAGLWRVRRKGLSLGAFAESVAVPAAWMVGIGRWGCLLNGCCVGRITSSPLGVHFLRDPEGVLRFPSQLFESLGAFAIALTLMGLERRLRWDAAQAKRGAVLWPLFLILYGLYRLAADVLRDGDRILGLRVGQYLGALALAVGAAWLIVSWRGRRRFRG